MTDLFAPLTPPNPAAVRPTCRRHRWEAQQCVRCGAHWDAIAARRGRLNRSRGNAIEREIAARLGLARVGQYGGPDDIRGALFAGQVKSGGAFPERAWRWLKAVPVDAGQVAILVLATAPGPGAKRRGVVIIDLDDWADLHGPETGA